MAQNRTCNLSVTGRPSSPLRHVFKVPPDESTCLNARLAGWLAGWLAGVAAASPPLMSMVPVRGKSLPVSSAALLWLHMGAT
jgi:hypothetical protein